MEQVKQIVPLEVKQEVLLPLRQDNRGGSDHGSSRHLHPPKTNTACRLH